MHILCAVSVSDRICLCLLGLFASLHSPFLPLVMYVSLPRMPGGRSCCNHLFLEDILILFCSSSLDCNSPWSSAERQKKPLYYHARLIFSVLGASLYLPFNRKQTAINKGKRRVQHREGETLPKQKLLHQRKE